jgi:hypothetical protein
VLFAWHTTCSVTRVVRGAIVVALLLSACRTAAPPLTAEPPPRERAYSESNRRFVATLARDGIEVDTEPMISTCDGSQSAVSCARCEVITAVDEIDPALIDQMAIAFARYPASVRKASGLAHVAFCRAITYEGDTDHNPAGLADPSSHRVFISVEYLRVPRAGASVESTVHHEVFHLLDYEVLGARKPSAGEWNALNPAGFAYREHGEHRPRAAGFVNAYAASNEHEDRASTFEFLMTRPDELCELAATDRVLARKVQLLRRQLARVEGANRLGMWTRCPHQAAKPASSARKRGGKRPDDLKQKDLKDR